MGYGNVATLRIWILLQNNIIKNNCILVIGPPQLGDQGSCLTVSLHQQRYCEFLAGREHFLNHKHSNCCIRILKAGGKARNSTRQRVSSINSQWFTNLTFMELITITILFDCYRSSSSTTNVIKGIVRQNPIQVWVLDNNVVFPQIYPGRLKNLCTLPFFFSDPFFSLLPNLL